MDCGGKMLLALAVLMVLGVMFGPLIACLRRGSRLKADLQRRLQKGEITEEQAEMEWSYYLNG